MMMRQHFQIRATRGRLRRREWGRRCLPPYAVERAMKRIADLIPWFLAAFIAYIFLFYLQFKFTGHPGSVELFTTLTDWLGFHGYEKGMRIGTRSVELFSP